MLVKFFWQCIIRAFIFFTSHEKIVEFLNEMAAFDKYFFPIITANNTLHKDYSWQGKIKLFFVVRIHSLVLHS